LPVTAFAVIVVASVLGCSGSDSPTSVNRRLVAGVDVGVLFAAPTAAELAAVRNDWAGRDVSVQGFRQDTAVGFLLGASPAQLRVVSHMVGGVRHYGAIASRAPAPAGSLPVLVYAHGGDSGVNVDELFLLGAGLGDAADDFVFVVPSFRSEELRLGSRRYRSEGSASPWDRDVDDALALLGAALANEPAADTARVFVAGFSRGGGVALLMAERDRRIDAVIEFFGPTDFFDGFAQTVIEEALLGRPRDLPGIRYLDSQYLQPLRRGEVTMAVARLELVRRSAVQFASQLPRLQVHHGTADPTVSVSQAQSLDRTLRAIGRTPPDYEFYLYEGGVHDALSLTGSVPRAVAFLKR
jgi:acetyl esterase/lipase